MSDIGRKYGDVPVLRVDPSSGAIELSGEIAAGDYNVEWSAFLSVEDAIQMRDVLTEFIEAQ